MTREEAIKHFENRINCRKRFAEHQGDETNCVDCCNCEFDNDYFRNDEFESMAVEALKQVDEYKMVNEELKDIIEGMRKQIVKLEALQQPEIVRCGECKFEKSCPQEIALTYKVIGARCLFLDSCSGGERRTEQCEK